MTILYESSHIRFRASSGKSSETLRPDEQSPVSLESRLQYFFRQQAAAEGLIPPLDGTEHHTANSNLGVGQILPSLLSPSGTMLYFTLTVVYIVHFRIPLLDKWFNPSCAGRDYSLIRCFFIIHRT